jgi:hypothetical protein
MTRDRSAEAFGIVLGGLGPILVGAALVPLRDELINANLALILVVIVVGAAAVGGWRAGAVAAVTSTLSYDFFFTQPYRSLTIDSADDVETTILLLIVGLAVGFVAARAQRSKTEAEASRLEVQRIHHIAELVASGAEPEDVLGAAQDELRDLLSLDSCQFEAPPVSSDRPRLERGGVITERKVIHSTPHGFTLPPEGVDLPVLWRGRPVGTFVLTPSPDVGVSLEEQVVAVAIADQVGAAIGGRRVADGGDN